VRDADTAFPHGTDVDLVDLLLTQHARIEELFTLVAGSRGQRRREHFEELARLMTVHETAEQDVVHPLSRELGDTAGIVDDRLDEERLASETLAELRAAGVDSDGFDTTLLLLREAVLTHARHEERYEFPALRAKVPAERLRELARTVRDIELDALATSR
jgi:hemerythrin superfamily protein